jgi:hypothetical protein
LTDAHVTDYIGEGHQLITDYRSMTAHLDDSGQWGQGAVVAQRPFPALLALGPTPDAMALLESLLNELTELFGPPVTGSPFTLTFAGSERHDGEEPYTWVVNGETLDEARRTLATLPTFQEWYEEQSADGEPDVVFETASRYSHRGIPEGCYYTDLRREQAELAEQQIPRSIHPTIASVPLAIDA